ncbi:hypothetical protein PG1C_12200 [Rugosibacter aromaticivorans]|uniref:Uncharacterized protein n=1 Tax=Rugosibacter aromaticivorans TaxID=1565605 RepID=A0A0C5JB57_9PROT|nr:hypothetical protein [Rugosibacter aromaticivorans]AJP48979.1 hypothetical protein PG1C_12200 [Rugosibacter aromaticivorans]
MPLKNNGFALKSRRWRYAAKQVHFSDDAIVRFCGDEVFIQLPLGVLAVNLIGSYIGGYLVGIAVAIFHIKAELPPERWEFSGNRPSDLLGRDTIPA